MKPRLTGLALLLIGGGIIGIWNGNRSPLTLALGAVLASIGVLTMISAEPGTFFRLDHFLPFANKRWQPSRGPSWFGQFLRRILPGSWFFDPATGKQGHARRLLRRLGPSVNSSPGRRLIQGICFLGFQVLFFLVCWPYTARPAPEGLVLTGWQLDRIDGQTGAFHFKTPARPENLTVAEPVYVVDPQALPTQTGLVGSFRIESWTASAASLQPLVELTPEQFDKFLLGNGSWTIHTEPPGRWPSHYADDLAQKEIIAAEFFLIIDPLVSISTAIAAGSWIWSLVGAGVILLVCVFIPRGFCGYLCPLGTLIDIFDWAIGRRVKRFRVGGEGWWVHLKYHLLLATLICSLFGILVAGFVSAIPVITRGFLFIGEPLQTGLLRGWHLVPPMNAGHWISILLFLAIPGLGLLRPRFWCKYVCPSGAVFSVANLFRASERKVEDSCINCNKCVEVCPFDAIKPDFTTRESDCTLCQTCGGVCPSHSIKFVERWNTTDLKVVSPLAPGETPIGRRGFMALWTGLTTAVVGSAVVTTTTKLWGRNRATDPPPVRPPGSIPESDFLQACIRCGECFKACPNNVLQSQGFDQGLDGLWTPVVNADWAGCESSCNACGQVCPTGAIRALPLAEKKSVRMGLAIVNQSTCLPIAGREACQLCVDECDAAGYGAIEFTRVHTRTDLLGNPLEDTGFVAPVVLADKCVGCGLCQTRCHGINVAEKGLLQASAIIIEAGPGKEDRTW